MKASEVRILQAADKTATAFDEAEKDHAAHKVAGSAANPFVYPDFTHELKGRAAFRLKRIWQPAPRGGQSGGPFRHHRAALQPRTHMSAAACTSRAGTEGTRRARRSRLALLFARWRGWCCCSRRPAGQSQMTM